MKALGFQQHGDFTNMLFFEAEKPVPEEGEVLVQLKASAFNHLDIWVRRGWPGLNLKLPHISGSDGAGIICEMGHQVKNFEVGDRVAICPGIATQEDEFTWAGEHSVSPHYKILGENLPGTHCEYIAVPASLLVKIPDFFSFEQAAAAGLVSLTAWRMLIKRAQIRPGEKVLVIGAGGGVNSMAIQIAKYAGCEVYATTSSDDKAAKAKSLGADEVVNYAHDSNWSKTLVKMTDKKGFDVVVDNVGQATFNESLKLVKPGGRIVIVGNTSGPNFNLDIRYLFAKQISLIGSTMGSPKDYHDVMALNFSKKIQPIIHEVFPFSSGLQAMEMMEKGQQFGKLVLRYT